MVAGLLPASARAADTAVGPYGCGPTMMWSGGWTGMIFGPLFMLLMLAVLIAAVVLLVRWIGPPWHGPWNTSAPMHYPPPDRTPIEILRERFARGEIDKDEFEERRRLLTD